MFLPFVFGAVVEHLTTDIGKYSIGRLRPHFLSVCKPDSTKYNCASGYITADVCTGDESLIREARLESLKIVYTGNLTLFLLLNVRFCRISRNIYKIFITSMCKCKFHFSVVDYLFHLAMHHFLHTQWFLPLWV